MSEQVFHIPYILNDKTRLFDLGQGIHSSVALVLKKGGGKIATMTQTLKKMRLQALAFGLLAVAQASLMGVSGVSAGKIVLAVLCALLGGLLWASQSGNKKAFARAQALYLQNNGTAGTLTVDEDGICECNEAGRETRFSWEDYRCCIMSEEAIVVVFYKPVMLIVSRTKETEDGLVEALLAFDKERTIYEVEVKEKKK